MSNDKPPLGPFERRLLAQLLAVHEERRQQSQPSERVRSRAPLRFLRSVMIALVATATLGSAAFAARGIWNPPLGGDDRGSPSAASKALPSAQRRLFSVLARPQRDIDRGAETERALRLLSPDIVNEIQTADVRVLFRDARRGLTAILLPVGRYQTGSARLSNGASATNGLCLLLATARNAVSYQCYSSRDAARVRMPATASGLAYGLVPDDVAAVRISYARGQRVSASVHDNFYALQAPREAGLMTGVSWLRDNGTTIAAVGRRSIASE